MTDKCKAKVFRGFHYYPCGRKATKGEYCGIHDPAAVAARDAKQRAKWDAEHKAKVNKSNETARILNAHDDLVAALEGVIRVADRATVEFDAARAALAKAKGES